MSLFSILEFGPNGRDISKSSFERYEVHLDEFRDRIPGELYSILRFSDLAYESGNTFYDSSLIEWCDRSNDLHERSTYVRIRSRNRVHEYRLEFLDPFITTSSCERSVHRTGELLCIEVSYAQRETYAIVLVFMNREMIRVESSKFKFLQFPLEKQEKH